MSAAEEVKDVVEDVVEVIEEAWVGEFTRRELLTQYGFVALIAAGVGGVGAYFLARRHMETKYEEILASEIASAKAFYQNLNKDASPEETAEKLTGKKEETYRSLEDAAEALRTYQGGETDDPEEPEDEESVVVESSVNVFLQNQADPSFDYEAEVAHRSPDKPYVITQEEFFQNEENFSQVTITYYQGDAVLADENDEEIPYPDPVVGEKNLDRFGHGSGDPRVVYVQNDRLSAQYEILLSDGKFVHEVLGLQHSDGGSRGRQQRNELRRFRGEDG